MSFFVVIYYIYCEVYKFRTFTRCCFINHKNKTTCNIGHFLAESEKIEERSTPVTHDELFYVKRIVGRGSKKLFLSFKCKLLIIHIRHAYDSIICGTVMSFGLPIKFHLAVLNYIISARVKHDNSRLLFQIAAIQDSEDGHCSLSDLSNMSIPKMHSKDVWGGGCST